MLVFYAILVLSVGYLQPSAALNAEEANAVCNLLEDGLMIFSGSACGDYYTCSNGIGSLASCTEGFSFSKDKQGCVLSSEISCVSSSDPCANAANGEFVAVPNSCTDFYYCNNGVATQGSCPDGLNFDATDQSCNYTTDYACTATNDGGSTSGSGETTTINLCAVVPGGVYFASSSSCQAWQHCSNGALTIGNCPSPYYFNVLTASCDYQSDVTCRQVTNNPETATNPDYLAGQACSTNGLVVSDNITCVGYYMCNNNVYSYGQCTNGNYFNPLSKTCVNRLNAVNNCNRCEDTSLQFVNLYQDNCVGYGYCKNGRIASTGVCPEGYFDETAQACLLESDEPQYAVCNDSLDESSSSSTTSSSSSTTDSSDSSSTSSGSTDSTVSTSEDDSTTDTSTTDASSSSSASTEASTSTTV